MGVYMKKITFITIISFFVNITLAQAVCTNCDSEITIGQNEVLNDVLKTGLGIKITTYLEEQGDVIHLDKAISKSNSFFIPMTSNKNMLKALYVIPIDGDFIIMILQMDLNNPELKFSFPSGKMIIVGLDGSMREEQSGVVFQEHDGLYKTLSKQHANCVVTCALFYTCSGCSFFLGMGFETIIIGFPIVGVPIAILAITSCVSLLYLFIFTLPPENCFCIFPG
jgi:hypothetical protein